MSKAKGRVVPNGRVVIKFDEQRHARDSKGRFSFMGGREKPAPKAKAHHENSLSEKLRGMSPEARKRVLATVAEQAGAAQLNSKSAPHLRGPLMRRMGSLSEHARGALLDTVAETGTLKVGKHGKLELNAGKAHKSLRDAIKSKVLGANPDISKHGAAIKAGKQAKNEVMKVVQAQANSHNKEIERAAIEANRTGDTTKLHALVEAHVKENAFHGVPLDSKVRNGAAVGLNGHVHTSRTSQAKNGELVNHIVEHEMKRTEGMTKVGPAPKVKTTEKPVAPRKRKPTEAETRKARAESQRKRKETLNKRKEAAAAKRKADDEVKRKSDEETKRKAGEAEAKRVKDAADKKAHEEAHKYDHLPLEEDFKSPHPVLYHGTSMENAENIHKNGFQPVDSRMRIREAINGATYLTSTHSYAAWYASGQAQGGVQGTPGGLVRVKLHPDAKVVNASPELNSAISQHAGLEDAKGKLLYSVTKESASPEQPYLSNTDRLKRFQEATHAYAKEHKIDVIVETDDGRNDEWVVLNHDKIQVLRPETDPVRKSALDKRIAADDAAKKAIDDDKDRVRAEKAKETKRKADEEAKRAADEEAKRKEAENNADKEVHARHLEREATRLADPGLTTHIDLTPEQFHDLNPTLMRKLLDGYGVDHSKMGSVQMAKALVAHHLEGKSSGAIDLMAQADRYRAISDPSPLEIRKAERLTALAQQIAHNRVVDAKNSVEVTKNEEAQKAEKELHSQHLKREAKRLADGNMEHHITLDTKQFDELPTDLLEQLGKTYGVTGTRSKEELVTELVDAHKYGKNSGVLKLYNHAESLRKDPNASPEQMRKAERVAALANQIAHNRAVRSRAIQSETAQGSLDTLTKKRQEAAKVAGSEDQAREIHAEHLKDIGDDDIRKLAQGLYLPGATVALVGDLRDMVRQHLNSSEVSDYDMIRARTITKEISTNLSAPANATDAQLKEVEAKRQILNTLSSDLKHNEQVAIKQGEQRRERRKRGEFVQADYAKLSPKHLTDLGDHLGINSENMSTDKLRQEVQSHVEKLDQAGLDKLTEHFDQQARYARDHVTQGNLEHLASLSHNRSVEMESKRNPQTGAAQIELGKTALSKLDQAAIDKLHNITEQIKNSKPQELVDMEARYSELATKRWFSAGGISPEERIEMDSIFTKKEELQLKHYEGTEELRAKRTDAENDVEKRMSKLRKNLLASSGITIDEAKAIADGLAVDDSLKKTITPLAMRTIAANWFHMMGNRVSGTLSGFFQDQSPDRINRAYAGQAKIHAGTVGGSPAKKYSTAGEDEKRRFVETQWHEMGHHIEFNNPQIQLNNMDWVKSRSTSPGLKKLKDITGNTGYRDDEVAYPDHFISPYVGKSYGEGGSTEVTSMGIEHFTTPSRMRTFAQVDPEHFYLTMGIIKTPNPRKKR